MMNRLGSVRRIVVHAVPFILALLTFPLPGSGYLKGDVDSDNKITLNEAINALQVASGVRSPLSSKTINVPGDIPTIQQAIDAAAEGDIISIAAGTYNEVLLIEKNRITIQGAGKESTIIDGGGQSVLVIKTAGGVAIKSLTIQNGRHGIDAGFGAEVEVRDITILDCSEKGIQAHKNSTALIADTTVRRSGHDGILLYQGSSAIFTGEVVSLNNGRNGFVFNSTSSALFQSATITANDNGRRGIHAIFSSSLISDDSTVTIQNSLSDGVGIIGCSSLIIAGGNWLSEENSRRGLVAAGASWVSLQPGSTLTVLENGQSGVDIRENSNAEFFGTVRVEDNSNHGLLIFISSSIYIGGGALINVKNTQGSGIGSSGIDIEQTSALQVSGGSLVVENSSGFGILVNKNSNVTLGGASTVKIANNQRDGIGIYHHSSGRFDAGTEITGNWSNGLSVGDNSWINATGAKVQANLGWGVSADDGSTARLENCTIMGNENGDVNLGFGSRGNLMNNTIGVLPISCDDTVLSRGTHVCP